MDLTPIFICGIFVLGFYKLIELCVRRRERIMLIEKLEGDALNEFIRNGGLPTGSSRNNIGIRYGILHFAAALLGLGTGSVVTFIVLEIWQKSVDMPYSYRNACSCGSVLLFTGLALIISFIIEYRLTQKKE